MAAAPLTRCENASVRLVVGLAERSARGAADGRADGASHDRAGDGAGRRPLFDRLAASGRRQGDSGDDEGEGGAFHGEILPMAELERRPPAPVPARHGKSIGPSRRLSKTIVSSMFNPVRL